MVTRKNFNISGFLLFMSFLVLCFASGFWVGLRYEKLDFVRVIDGDTFVVKNRRDGQEWRVRLWGVNAPDSKECFFDIATEVLRDELMGKKITYQRYGYDGYGRILAEVFVDGKSLEEKLVERGVVKVYEAAEVHDGLKPSEEFVKNLMRIEGYAKEKKVGVWSGECASR